MTIQCRCDFWWFSARARLDSERNDSGIFAPGDGAGADGGLQRVRAGGVGRASGGVAGIFPLLSGRAGGALHWSLDTHSGFVRTPPATSRVRRSHTQAQVVAAAGLGDDPAGDEGPEAQGRRPADRASNGALRLANHAAAGRVLIAKLERSLANRHVGKRGHSQLFKW